MTFKIDENWPYDLLVLAIIALIFWTVYLIFKISERNINYDPDPKEEVPKYRVIYCDYGAIIVKGYEEEREANRAALIHRDNLIVVINKNNEVLLAGDFNIHPIGSKYYF